MGFMNFITKGINDVGFKAKKHSPEILVVAGVGGIVVSTVMACRATTKVDGVLTEYKEKKKDVETAKENEDVEDYTDEDAKKDMAIIKVQTAIKLAKLYLPSAIVGTLSLSCVITSNNILRQRNASLTAAYAAVSQGFKQYRDRVIEKYGKEVDTSLLLGSEEKEIETTITDESGKEKKVKEKANVVSSFDGSDYVKFFMKHNPNWHKNPDFIENFIKMQESYANDLLVVKGHLALNEVYDLLGFPHTKAGMVVGWIYDPTNPVGDNCVKFDFRKVYLDSGEMAYAIDFNVDGDIYSRLK